MTRTKGFLSDADYPARLVVLDVTSGRIVALLATVGDTTTFSMMPVGDLSMSLAERGR
jgi:hypothetical protein